jgi:AraC-like DNA-binding protein
VSAAAYNRPVHAKIFITANEPRMWDKLEQMTLIDPSVSGGIDDVIQGRRSIPRNEPIGPISKSGHEEIYEIDPGFCVHIADTFIDHDWRLTIRSRENNVRFRIAFSGEAAYFDRKQKLSDEYLGCSYIVRPAGDSLTASFTGGVRYRYCSLNVTQAYLVDFLGLGSDELTPVLSHWERQETVMGHFAASKAALALASRFFRARSSSAWRDVEVRSNALELLRVLFEDWRTASPHSRASMRISPPEREKLFRIRDLIKANPGKTYTLPALCAQFRLSRKKLHYGFKRFCGVSVHEFQTEVRMQLALDLLQTTSLPIAQVSEKAGFSEPTNFTAAFSKHFAVLPSQVRSTP